MRIIFSPTKTMCAGKERPFETLPVFLPETEKLLTRLREMTGDELKKLWGCNDKIAAQNIERLGSLKLRMNLNPAILSFEGLAFKTMEAERFSDEELSYLNSKLRILSGFYGVLKPMDGISPYRLDMENKLRVGEFKDLYDFWGDKMYREVIDEEKIIINLASGEYSRCIEKYLEPEDRMINCSFVENADGKLRQKATFAKMARGAMLRYLAQIRAERPEELQGFNALGFKFRPDLSSENEYFFEKLSD